MINQIFNIRVIYYRPPNIDHNQNTNIFFGDAPNALKCSMAKLFIGPGPQDKAMVFVSIS
jgi:hypothetical protein